mgnify:CR=1 FL=1
MERDPSVFVYGLGVDDPKGMYGSTLGLDNVFGADRCFDTPLAEDAVTGMGIGAAIAETLGALGANLTLIGRARGQRFLALAGEERIVFDADAGDAKPDDEVRRGAS